MVAKEKLKTKNARNPPDHAMNISEKGVLNLEATVVCASDIPKKVLTCLGCVQREVGCEINNFICNIKDLF